MDASARSRCQKRRMYLAHKLGHATDLETGAIVGVSVHYGLLAAALKALLLLDWILLEHLFHGVVDLVDKLAPLVAELVAGDSPPGQFS